MHPVSNYCHVRQITDCDYRTQLERALLNLTLRVNSDWLSTVSFIVVYSIGIRVCTFEQESAIIHWAYINN